MIENWWSGVGKASSAPSEVSKLRDSQWDYFEGRVAPVLSDLVSRDLSGGMSGHLKQRLRLPNRFRPSQLLFALSADYPMPEEGLVWASAALELTLLARLIQDDIADRHTMRWGLPSLRVIFGDSQATQVVALLNHLTTLCATNLSVVTGSTSGLSAPAIFAEFARQMTAAMLEEIEWSRSGERTISLTRYESIASRKVSTGRLTIDLLPALNPEIDSAALAQAVRLIDLAASLTNDVTEANLRRGLEEVRFVEGETRGEHSEIQLGRPTIFSVILGSDRYLLDNSVAAVAAVQPFSGMSAREIFDFLRSTGAIRNAEERIEELESRAMTLISPDTSTYVLLDKSVSPNITQAAPKVEI